MKHSRLPRHLEILALWAGAAISACGSEEVPRLDLQAPVMSQVASPTNDNPITLNGTGAAGATIKVKGGRNEATGEVAEDGTFAVLVLLNENSANALVVVQTLQRVDSPEATVAVVHDGIAPTTPVVDPATSPTSLAMQTLTGTAEGESMISVSGGAGVQTAAADASGRFSVAVNLNTQAASPTTNTLSVVAKDLAGNESAPSTVVIEHVPEVGIEAPVLNMPPAYASAAALDLAGTARAGLSIRVTGGAGEATATVGGAGTFSVRVTLNLNMRNTLSAFAVDPESNRASTPATAIVTHDSVAPSAPNVDPVSSPTGATSVLLTGTTEAMATITVSIRAANATTRTAMTNADARGAFSVMARLHENTVNTLAVTAKDLAGNESPAFSLTVEHDQNIEAPPTVNAVNTPTNQNPITISGTTGNARNIQITGGVATVTASVAADMTFSASVMLSANAQNTLYVSHVGSNVGTTVVVVHDDIAPSAPVVNPIASPTNQTSHNVTGTSEAGATLSVTGGVSSASGVAAGDGRFSVPVTIATEATSTLSVVATDRALNVSPATTISIRHSSSVPDAPIVNNVNPPPTNQPTRTVTGRVTEPDPALSVRVRGGSMEVTGPTDGATGNFAIDVPLNFNAANTLEVTSFEGAIEGPPTLVTIIHDNIVPTTPVDNLITVGSGQAICLTGSSATVSGAMGSVESSTPNTAQPITVRITNTVIESFPEGTDTTATAGGTFSRSVNVCRGEILEIRALDAAGNVSTHIEKVVP